MKKKTRARMLNRKTFEAKLGRRRAAASSSSMKSVSDRRNSDSPIFIRESDNTRATVCFRAFSAIVWHAYLSGGQRLQHLVARAVKNNPALIDQDKPVDQRQKILPMRDQ